MNAKPATSRTFTAGLRHTALASLAFGLFACALDPIASPPDRGTPETLLANLPNSCAFACGSECGEPDTAFDCPALRPWEELPHAESCGDPLKLTMPKPQEGTCKAGDAVGEAARRAGPLPNGGLVLPDGHRLRPAGREVLFDEAGLTGGFPMSLLAIPGTRLVLVSDGGIQDNALRLIDLDKLAGTEPPVLATIPFERPSSLYYGIEWLPPSSILASGGGDGRLYAFDIDTQAGTLTRAKNRDITLGKFGNDTYYTSALAKTADAARLLAAPSDHVDSLLVISLGQADYGAILTSISLGGSTTVFDLKLDPFDPAGKTFYASDMKRGKLLEIDGAAAKITKTIDLQKNPEQLAFLDAVYMVVTESDSDSIAVVNRVSGEVEARVPVFEKDAPRGFSPSALAYDATNQRLFATLAGVNAVEVYDVTMGMPPQIVPKGRIPTAWWPTAVMADTDGSPVILSGKGHGTGTDSLPYTWSQGPITDRMRGSIQHVPAAELANLDAMSAIVEENRKLGDSEGKPEVSCPGGDYDFPIPRDNTSGPSKYIKHVIVVIRENKTYDGVFGDRPDLGEGDPKLIMASDGELQDKIWQNARQIAKQFTNFDNFYTDAEQSLQGHTWTVYGRSNDFMERAWLTVWGRGTRAVTTPLSATAIPEEGSIFTWLSGSGVDYENMGEIIGGGPNGFDSSYPGLVYAQNLPDIDKSCYLAARLRVSCNLKPFVYAVQPNDHTYGGTANAAAPEVMIAVNDEATGMLLDALSHSPIWKESLLIVTEDDPQDGGDHIDLHRTLLLFASPWVRRGYVSQGHYDMASIYKLVAHVYGISYNNESMRNALLPLDAFTSTPDYTPYTYLPRTVAAPCNADQTAEAEEAEAWDFTDIDDQPGLSQQMMKMLKRSRTERGIRLVSPKRGPSQKPQ